MRSIRVYLPSPFQTAWLIYFRFILSQRPFYLVTAQPRDYLNSFALRHDLRRNRRDSITPALNACHKCFKVGTQYLFLCSYNYSGGAISGFHSLVASGTTAKQLDKEGDVKLIGYGGMLIEGVLAILATLTAVYLTTENYGALLKGGPVNVFATGLATFMTSFGLDATTGKTFTALAARPSP